MKKIICFTFLAICFSINCSFAQTTFEKAVNLLLGQNYDLTISEGENEIQLNDLKTENNLPETEIGFSKRWGNRDGQKTGLEVNQGFDWPGLYAARNKEHKLTREALAMLQKSRIIDKKTEISLLLIDYIAAKKRFALMTEVYRNMDRLVGKYKLAYEAGEVNIIDRNKVIIESARAKAAMMSAEQERNNIVSAILDQGNDNSVLPLLNQLDEYPELTLYSEEEYESLINSEDPMLGYYRKMSDVTAQQKKVARMGYLPSFSVGYGYEYEEGQVFHGFNVGVGLPIFSNRNKSKSASFRHLMNQNNLDSEKLRRITDMRNRIADVRLMEETISTFRELFENQNQLDILKKALDGGEINLFTYIADVNFFTEARAGYIEADYNRAKLLVELNKLK